MASVLALVLYALHHAQGIGLTPDGWAYWQGAVSLASGKGYAYFSGRPLHFWPPLYSAYLSLWVSAIGPTGLALVLANGLLVCAQAGLWCFVLLTLHVDDGNALTRLSLGSTVAYYGVAAPLVQRGAAADVLKHALLPVLLLSLWKAARAATTTTRGRWTALACTSASLLVLTHNSAVAFLLAAAVVLVVARQPLSAACVFGLPTAIWFASRVWLQQFGSHRIGIGAGREGPMHYAQQLVEGVGKLLVPAAAHMPELFFLLLVGASGWLLKSGVGGAALRTCLLFAYVALGAVYGLFNVTWVADPLEGRFVVFFVFIVLPSVILALAKRRTAQGLVAVVALAPTLYWTAGWTWRSIRSEPETLGYPRGYVLHATRISPEYRDGPPRPTESGTLIAPLNWEQPDP